MDNQRKLFWTFVVCGSAAIGFLLWTEPEAPKIVEPLGGDDIGAVTSALLDAELEVEPIFLLEQRTQLPPVEELWATIEYPIFVPRRDSMLIENAVVEDPFPQEQETEMEPSGPPTIRLVGTVVKSDLTMALITDETNSFLRPVRIGEDVDGWTVLKIDSEAVTLSSGDETLELSILAQQGSDSE